jgi:hypothetical protein
VFAVSPKTEVKTTKIAKFQEMINTGLPVGSASFLSGTQSHMMLIFSGFCEFRGAFFGIGVPPVVLGRCPCHRFH